MLQLPVPYSKVAKAVNQCAKMPRFTALIAMLGGTGNVTTILFTVFQSYIGASNKDRKYWVSKLKTALIVPSSLSAKLDQMCNTIISNLGG